MILVGMIMLLMLDETLDVLCNLVKDYVDLSVLANNLSELKILAYRLSLKIWNCASLL